MLLGQPFEIAAPRAEALALTVAFGLLRADQRQQLLHHPIAVVAANGTTVTITWSENLDQTQAVSGNAYAIAPNGGIGIAGTAAAISYPLFLEHIATLA